MAKPCKSSNLFFVHIPKNGGATVEKSMCPQNERYPTAELVKKRFNYEKMNKPLSHLTADEYRTFSRDKLENATTFAILRDPYERFVSEAQYNRLTFNEQMWKCQRASPHEHHDVFAHCRPQVDYVGLRGEKVDKIFHIDRYHEVRKFLNDHGHVIAKSHNRSETPSKDLVQMLPKHVRSWIESTYAQDFRLLTQAERRTT